MTLSLPSAFVRAWAIAFVGTFLDATTTGFGLLENLGEKNSLIKLFGFNATILLLWVPVEAMVFALLALSFYWVGFDRLGVKSSLGRLVGISGMTVSLSIPYFAALANLILLA